jgi:hypothetical protein
VFDEHGDVEDYIWEQDIPESDIVPNPTGDGS